MWIWITCLVVLIVCFIVAWRLMMKSYDLMPSNKKYNPFHTFTPSEVSYYMETIKSIKSKLKSLEDKSDYYESQIDVINKKLKNSDQGDVQIKIAPPPAFKEDDEDWKELYYEENAKKEKLENDLDVAEQEIGFLNAKLEELNTRLDEEILAKKKLEESTPSLSLLKFENDELRRQLSEIDTKQSGFEEKLNYLRELEDKAHSLQIEKSELQQKLDEVTKHHGELVQQLESSSQLKSQYEETINSLALLRTENDEFRQQINKISASQSELEMQLENERQEKNQLKETLSVFSAVRNENEGLKHQITEMVSRQSEIEGKLLHLKELEDKVSAFEEEKSRMIANLETIINQTRMHDS